MPIIPIPLTHGQHEEADAKLLPQGLLTVAQNVRYRKDGRLGTRFGYRFDSTAGAPSASLVVGAGSFESKHDVAILRGSLTLPVFATRHEYGSYSGISLPATTGGVLSQLPVLGVGIPEVKFAGRGFNGALENVACDCASSGGITVVVHAGYAYGGAVTSGYVTFHDSDTGAHLASLTPDIGAGIIRNAKVVFINGLACVFYVLSTNLNNIRMTGYNAATFSIATPALTVVTSLGNRAPYFDVSPGGAATEAYLIYQDAVNRVNFGTVTSAGVFASLATQVTVNNPCEARCAISPTAIAPATDIIIAVNDGAAFTTGDLYNAVYRRGTGFTTAYTQRSTTGRAIGYPVAGPDASTNWQIAYNSSGNPSLSSRRVGRFSPATGPSEVVGYTLASKPFRTTGIDDAMLVLCEVDTAPAVGALPLNGVYLVVACGSQGWARCLDGGALPTDSASTIADPRRNFGTVTAIGNEPGLAAVVGALPVGTSSDTGFALVRIESGRFAESYSAASLNKQLFFSGPIISIYDGQSITDDAFIRVPTIESAGGTIIGGGAMAPGTFLYVAVYEWIDGFGYRHLSAPSLPFSVTLTAGQNASTVNVMVPDLSNKSTGNVARQVGIRLYRSIAGGSTFYDALDQAFAINANQWTIIIDTASDATLLSREILYTQGVRGGLSGNHERDCPPPARYICAGSSRLLIGGLDNPYQVQWSQLQFDGEPIVWANDPQWRATVDGRVTGVGELDGTWFIFTRDSIWTVVGEGPDDNGAGSFSTPQRLPSSVGCISHKSILKTGKGLMFQSVRGFELLVRGQAEPQWMGQPVRDTIALFPYVSAAVINQVEQVCYWAVTDSAGATGCLIVYDIRIGEWYVDTFYTRAIKALSIYDGKLVIDGGIIETAAYTDDDTGAKTTTIIPIVTLGDIRAFGPTGWGRYKKVQVLGEARDVTVAWSLTLDVSYDSGKTFAETATWTRASLATAIGDVIDGAEHAFMIQRCDSVRLRLSITTPSPTEGLVFNGLQLEVYPADGSKRQPSAMRAA